MKPTSLLYALISVLALFALAACGPADPTRTPTAPVRPQPNSVGTPSIVATTPTRQATSLPSATATPVRTPTATPTPTLTSKPTETPTATPTATETPQATIISTPVPAATALLVPGINVGQDELNAGIAKWSALGVERYEMVVRVEGVAPFAGAWTLLISPGDVETISYARDPLTPTTPPALMAGEALRFLSVEGQFASVQQRLTGGDFGAALESRVDYFVAFDPVFGYPTSVEIKPKPGVKSTTLGSSTTIQRITILKRGTPTVPTLAPTLDVPATSQPPTAPPATALPTAVVPTSMPSPPPPPPSPTPTTVPSPTQPPHTPTPPPSPTSAPTLLPDTPTPVPTPVPTPAPTLGPSPVPEG